MTRAASTKVTSFINVRACSGVFVRVSRTEQVSRLMKVCHTRRIPVVGYSGGTSLEGHFTPTRGGICVDFSRMDKIIALHKDDLDVVVQPGVGWVAADGSGDVRPVLSADEVAEALGTLDTTHPARAQLRDRLRAVAG